MTYRDAPCLFCTEPVASTCPRCAAQVCAAHRAPGARWCAICEQERLDTLEFAVAEERLRTPAMLEVEGRGGGGVVFFNAVSMLVHAASGPIRRARAKSRAQREFEEKTQEEIAAWRATYVAGSRPTP